MRRNLIEIDASVPRFKRALPYYPETRNGRSKEKNVAVAARHASLRRCLEGPDLYRGQGFRRVAPSSPRRPEDRDLPGPSGSQGEVGRLKKPRMQEQRPAPQ